jgi:hypothetical protein
LDLRDPPGELTKRRMSDSESMASRSSSWLTTASARKSSISLPRKTIRSRRRRPMASPEPAPPPMPSDSALHIGGTSAANEGQGFSLRRGCCCLRREEAAQAGARAHGCLTSSAAAAATERDAVTLALPAAISALRSLTGWSGRRRCAAAATLEKRRNGKWITHTAYRPGRERSAVGATCLPYLGFSLGLT